MSHHKSTADVYFERRRETIHAWLTILSWRYWMPPLTEAQLLTRNDDFVNDLYDCTLPEIRDALAACACDPSIKYFPSPGQVLAKMGRHG